MATEEESKNISKIEKRRSKCKYAAIEISGGVLSLCFALINIYAQSCRYYYSSEMTFQYFMYKFAPLILLFIGFVALFTGLCNLFELSFIKDDQD